MVCVVPIQQTTKKSVKGFIFINKKKRTLKNLNLWMDEEYLQRLEENTVRDHKRDIIPNCIISHRYFFMAWFTIIISNAYDISCRKFLDAIQVLTAITGITN